MPAATSFVIAGLVISAVGTAVQFRAGKKQAKAGRKAAKESQKIAALEARRARRRVIREARIARGAASNVAAQVGATGSGLNSLGARIGSEAGAASGFSTQTEALGRNITKFGIQASKAASLGAIGGGIASLGGLLIGNSKAFSTLGD